MSLSAFDLYSVGIGPSSSHTVGPMRAAKMFADLLRLEDLLDEVLRVKVELFGSLGATGHGHGSEGAVLLGLHGEEPESVDPDWAGRFLEQVRVQRSLRLVGSRLISFDCLTDLILHPRRSLPAHPNGMTFSAFDSRSELLREVTYFSVGGGFIVDASGRDPGRDARAERAPVRFPFDSAAGLLKICRSEKIGISDVVLANELSWRTQDAVRTGLLDLWTVMASCVEAGYHREGLLPGGLQVRRRAPGLYRRLTATSADGSDPLRAMEWVNLFALSVNEENAAGGRVVTAPTNGAAGILPAVLHYYVRFVPGADEDGIVRFLLTAAAIGMLFKQNASISGAEVGCQGEVGSACAMAAGALCEVLGGSPEQVENAAEMGIEHNLGLTCDPVAGLVQVPCIERNAMASMKAINAARLAIHGDGHHTVTLDQAIETMRATGRDMHHKYKETSLGGLAVHVVEC
ncbi:L-serine ammonia-lyase [Nocardioides taihuensis]|uniref:L-serine dehydratase n=1 Tax=Nocardioides taihuensis TaxID=1835606 RepID=A0ABW0BED9_9ACTN